MIWKLVFIVRLTFQSFLNDGSILVILYLSGLVWFILRASGHNVF